MKKLIYFLAGSFLLCLSSNASAQYFEEGGIAYNVLSATEHTVEVAPLECTYYRGNINIPSTVVYNDTTYDVVALGEEAFAYSTISSVTIPSSVTRIKNSCFMGNRGMSTINIPASVTGIEAQALAAYGVTAINVDENNPNYRSIGGVVFSKDTSTVIQCPTGKSGVLTLPSNTTHVALAAFAYCNALTGITLPEGLRSIETCAFFGDHQINNIVIPASVTYIGTNPFGNCKVLNNLTIAAGNTHYYMDGMAIYSMGGDTLLSCHKSADSVFLPNTLRVVYGFLYNKDVKYIHIPDNVAIIGDNAFCSSSLISIDMPNHLEFIDAYAFSDCDSLIRVGMPSSLDRMGEGVFEYCSHLPSIDIPNGLQVIPYMSFYFCEALSSITWGDAVEAIDSFAFGGCAFEELLLPPTLRSVRDGAFNGYYDGTLRRVAFSAPVDTIEAEAFFGQPLELLHLKNSIPPVTTWMGCLNDVDSIIVPCGSLNAYESDSYWSLFAGDYYEECNGIDTPASRTVSVSPNPATDHLTVRGIDGCRRVELVNMIGQTVLSRETAGGIVELDVHGLERGSYFLRIHDHNNIATHKVILR